MKINIVLPRFFLLVLFSAISSNLHAVPQDEIDWNWPSPPTFPNEAYGPKTDVNPDLIGDNHLFDVWVPDGDGPYPVMIYAHGGGFKSGSKVKALGSMPKLAEDKVVFISINYTLGQGPAIAIKDGIDAINYIKVKHEKYKIDPEKIFLSGNSAGGIMMNYIIFDRKMPGILGTWQGAYYRDQAADLSIDNLREVGIPVVVEMGSRYPEDKNHSALAAFNFVSDNRAAGNFGMFKGGGGDQVWLNGEWILNVNEGIHTGESYPGMAEWIYSTIDQQTPTPTPTSPPTTSPERVYELWEREPVTNRIVSTKPEVRENKLKYFPYDEDWEHWSYPIGNGYMGANVFGRTDVERIQLTEKTLFNTGLYGLGGLTSFAEIDIHFNHEDVEKYKRSLNLNDAVAHVSYLSDGVRHTREMFVSYPDQVMVIKLRADKPGALSFELAPRIPYLKSLREEDKKTGKVVAKGKSIILSGTLPNEGNNFEAQFRVLNDGGKLKAKGGSIKVEGANSVTILVAAGTNYELSPEVFLNSNRIKLDPSRSPHERLTKIMDAALAIGPEALKERHLADYKNLFGRVQINLNSKVSVLPTHELLEGYQGDAKDTYLEELMFQYGRYLLISSSREKTLPSGLQGVWSAYEITPWTGGYWHNINVQMNYWGAFVVNIAETFEAYINYYKAYHPRAQENARAFLNEHHPDRVSDDPDQNGWAIGTGATPYKINMPGGHSGPGTGGFTTKMLMDYYEYTLDKDYLEEVAYPALLGMSRLFSKTLVPQDDLLLVSPSASPENPITKEQLVGMPGHFAENGRHYVTKGCTFDQGFVWENHTDVLKLAEILGKEESFLETIRAELPKLDPILIGDDGQIKEWREETTYSSIGQKSHRHISHLCPLYPGTLINSSTPEWKAAAIKTLNFRGDVTTGWAMAHRINCWARLNDGDRAHKIYQLFIEEKTVPNLWTLHPPFQIDGNFGVMAGVAEMLLQSHEGVISVLPALPEAWNTGSFDGLVARGNFVLSARWTEMNLTNLSVTARSGGTCRLKTEGLDKAHLVDANGKKVSSSISKDGVLTFETLPGQTLQIKYMKKDD